MIENNLAICTLLWTIFGVQHSLLARPGTKSFVRNNFGQAFEVHFYPLFYFISQCIAFLAMYDIVRHLSANIIFFQITGIGETIVYWLNRLANLFLILTVFHFDIGKFIGFTQFYVFFRKKLRAKPKVLEKCSLNSKFLYRYIRHPMYLGIILVYITSTTIYTELFFMNLLCILVYIELGSHFEEKSLLLNFGSEYESYMGTTKKYLPFIR